MHVVVYGAGAVGSVLGGMLSLRQHDVTLVGRAALRDAVAADGLRLKSATGEYVARPRVVTSLSASDVPPDGIILLTMKSHDVEAAVAALAGIPDGVPVVCFQNGVASEELAATRLPRVYGGVCRMTCSMVQPGHASFRARGRVIVGAWPKGSDATGRALAAAFADAGFDAASSRAIMADKWLKLAVNAQSVFSAVIDPRDHDTNEFQDLKRAILEETRRVYRAAKIRARSCDGRDPSLEDMIAELKRPLTRKTEHGVRVHNSTWQDLYTRRPRIEAEYFHGPVIELGRAHGVPTPYHRGALGIARRCLAAGTGPDTVRLADLTAMIELDRGKVA